MNMNQCLNENIHKLQEQKTHKIQEQPPKCIDENTSVGYVGWGKKKTTTRTQSCKCRPVKKQQQERKCRPMNQCYVLTKIRTQFKNNHPNVSMRTAERGVREVGKEQKKQQQGRKCRPTQGMRKQENGPSTGELCCVGMRKQKNGVVLRTCTRIIYVAKLAEKCRVSVSTSFSFFEVRKAK